MGLQTPFCVVIGHPISHSLSPILHNTAAQYHNENFWYYALHVEPSDVYALKELFVHPQFLGANVTLPYKSRIREFINEEDDTARKIGAVNTIVRYHDSLKGYNTDVYGFIQKLLPFRNRLTGEKAVVFGSGGASKAVVYGLDQLNMGEILIISRNPDSTLEKYRGISEIVSTGSYLDLQHGAGDAVLYVNTTPLGMAPKTLSSPVPDELTDILKNSICYDIVYTPMETRFLQQAKANGAETIDGLDMFIHQGDKAFQLWTGKHFPYEIVKQKLLEKLQVKSER